MSNIEEHKTWADVVFEGTKWITITSGIVIAWNKTVAQYFKYKLSFFDDRTKEIIKTENVPLVTSVELLSESVAKLTKSVGALEQQIKEMNKP